MSICWTHCLGSDIIMINKIHVYWQHTGAAYELPNTDSMVQKRDELFNHLIYQDTVNYLIYLLKLFYSLEDKKAWKSLDGHNQLIHLVGSVIWLFLWRMALSHCTSKGRGIQADNTSMTRTHVGRADNHDVVVIYVNIMLICSAVSFHTLRCLSGPKALSSFVNSSRKTQAEQIMPADGIPSLMSIRGSAQPVMQHPAYEALIG